MKGKKICMLVFALALALLPSLAFAADAKTASSTPEGRGSGFLLVGIFTIAIGAAAIWAWKKMSYMGDQLHPSQTAGRFRQWILGAQSDTEFVERLPHRALESLPRKIVELGQPVIRLMEALRSINFGPTAIQNALKAAVNYLRPDHLKFLLNRYENLDKKGLFHDLARKVSRITPVQMNVYKETMSALKDVGVDPSEVQDGKTALQLLYEQDCPQGAKIGDIVDITRGLEIPLEIPPIISDESELHKISPNTIVESEFYVAKPDKEEIPLTDEQEDPAETADEPPTDEDIPSAEEEKQ